MDTPDGYPPPFTKVRQRPDGKWEPADDATATHYVAPPLPVVAGPRSDPAVYRDVARAMAGGVPVYLPAGDFGAARFESLRIEFVEPVLPISPPSP